jgi:tRNA(fMet)-specific endonuclease VapC
MAGFLLDNNHLSAAIARVSTVRERIGEFHRAGHRSGTCFPVLCALETGIQQTKDPAAYRRRLNYLLSQVRLWPIDHEIARVYGEVYLELKARGRVLSQVDMMLAALARLMNLTVLTSDLDFEALPDVRTENWLA